MRSSIVIAFLVAAAFVPRPALGMPAREDSDEGRMVRELEAAIQADPARPLPWRELQARLEACIPPGWRAAVLHPDLFHGEPAPEDRAEVLAGVLARAETLKAALREPSRRGLPGEDPRGALERVLARPEFRRTDASAGFWSWLDRQLSRMLDWFFGFLGGLGMTGFIASRLVLVAVYVGLCTLFVVLLVRRLREDRAAAIRAAPVDARSLDDQGRSPEDFRADGDRLAAEGRWLDALAAWRLWVLLDLDRRGVLRYRSSHYHRDFIAQVRTCGAPATAVSALRALFASYDRARYGRAFMDHAASAEFRGAAAVIAAGAAAWVPAAAVAMEPAHG